MHARTHIHTHTHTHTQHNHTHMHIVNILTNWQVTGLIKLIN